MKLLTKILAACLAVPACAIGAAPSGNRIAGTIAGPDGTWDYASFDGATGRIFVARATNVSVFDPQAPSHVTSIGRLAHGHAALAVADNRLLATSGTDGRVLIIDRATGAQKAVSVGLDPDAALIEPGGHRAWVMVAKSGKATEIDIDGAKILRSIAFKPGLEFGLVAENVLYVNNEDTNLLYRADLKSGKALAPIAMPGCEAPSGLGYDERSHQLVSACSNGKAAIVSTTTGQMTKLLAIGRGPDAVIMDDQRHLAFIPCGENGVLDTIALGDKTPRLVDHISTEPGARTGAINPRDGTLYLPVARFQSGGPKKHPAMVPGTFHLIIVKTR